MAMAFARNSEANVQGMEADINSAAELLRKYNPQKSTPKEKAALASALTRAADGLKQIAENSEDNTAINKTIGQLRSAALNLNEGAPPKWNDIKRMLVAAAEHADVDSTELKSLSAVDAGLKKAEAEPMKPDSSLVVKAPDTSRAKKVPVNKAYQLKKKIKNVDECEPDKDKRVEALGNLRTAALRYVSENDKLIKDINSLINEVNSGAVIWTRNWGIVKSQAQMLLPNTD